jgi:hypothetical protein
MKKSLEIISAQRKYVVKLQVIVVDKVFDVSPEQIARCHTANSWETTSLATTN